MTIFQFESNDTRAVQTAPADKDQSNLFADAYAIGSGQAKAQLADKNTVVADSGTPSKPKPAGDGEIRIVVPGNGPFSGPVTSNEQITPAQAARSLAERFKL